MSDDQLNDPLIAALLKGSATIDEVTTLTAQLYAHIWADWYRGVPDARKASLSVTLDDENPSYSASLDRINVRIGLGNLESGDIRVVDAVPWPIWKVQLIHEMLHEVQVKVRPTPTAKAHELANNPRFHFDGPGHDAVFYQVIAEKAGYFGMTPEQFARSV